jgi:hypothetical protein
MDLSKLSDDELQQLYDKGKGGAPPPAQPGAPAVQPGAQIDLSKLSTAELQQLYDKGKPPPTQGDVDAAMVAPPDLSSVKARTEDVLTRAASSLSFGTAEKAKAAIRSTLGEGAYDELLAKYREETKQAGDRLGPVGAFLADVGGGVLSGSAIAKVGLPLLGKLTIMGRLPATASLPMKMLAGGAEGSLYGAASGAGHTDTGQIKDYLHNAEIGGLLGGVTGAALPVATAGVQRVITPFPTTDPVRARAMQTLADAGVDVSAGTKTGSPKLRMAEDILAKQPLGGPNLTDEQMAQVTRSVMEKAGITGPRVATPDVVKDGFNTVGGKINSLQKPYAVPVDDTLLNTAAKVESDVLPRVGRDNKGAVQYYIDKITNAEKLTPDMAQSIRSDLLKDIRGAEGAHQEALIELKNGLDDALARTMQKAGDDAGVVALNEARNQYAHLHILSDALNRSGAAGMRGELTPSALAAALKSSVGKVGFTKGEGDLNDLARASAGYLQPSKDSGTSTREGYWNPARYALGAGGRLAINNPVMQKLWGNQAAATPVPPSLLQAPVAGAANAAGANPGPADRIMGLLQAGVGL